MDTVAVPASTARLCAARSPRDFRQLSPSGPASPGRTVHGNAAEPDDSGRVDL